MAVLEKVRSRFTGGDAPKGDSLRRNRIRIKPDWDRDAFGNVSERIARLLGTGRYLLFQTIVCITWITYNAITTGGLRFDPYPFILLTLALSLQASYAAPLILLAQNRQDDRDRAQSERDRQLSQRTQAEAEFLARELASVRLQLADIVTSNDLESAFDRLTAALNEQVGRDASPDRNSASDRDDPDNRDRNS